MSLTTLPSARTSRFSRFALSAAAAAAVTLAGGAVHEAQAQLLVDISGGTVLSAANDDDNVYGGRTLGFTGAFFGQPITTIGVGVNGNLNFSGDTSYSPQALPGGPARIDALHYDLYVYPGYTITEAKNPGVWYSATWRVGAYCCGSYFHEVQTVIFGADAVVQGFRFRAGDIVMTYSYDGPARDVTVGLNKGDGATFAPLPGTPNGYATPAQGGAGGLLPNFKYKGEALLFRPDSAGRYVSAIIHVPGAGCRADFNGVNGVSVQDIYDFLGAWNAGCP